MDIYLMCAERAWSLAMQLKNEAENKLGDEARNRIHLNKRLAKVTLLLLCCCVLLTVHRIRIDTRCQLNA